MLAIRLQRTGRSGHAQFRIIVQDAHRSPTSGSIVYRLGYYNPHAKTATIDKEKADFYLEHGAQPSDRVARLLKSEGVRLPAWVKVAANKSKTARHPEKLRQNQPAASATAEASEATAAVPAEPATEPATATVGATTDEATTTPTAEQTETAAQPDQPLPAEPTPSEVEASTEATEASAEAAQISETTDPEITIVGSEADQSADAELTTDESTAAKTDESTETEVQDANTKE